MRPAVYLPYGSLTAVNALPPPSLAVFLWTAVEPTSVTTAVRDVVRSSDPALPIFELGTVAQTFRDSLAARRAVAWLMMVLAGLALVLALGGIYGVLSYVVGQRLREIGLRAALGATRAGLLRLVFRQGLALTAVGLGFGLLGAVFGGVVLGSLLVGVSPFDPLTFLVVAMVVTGASCLATLVPARRALRVEPGVVLRLE
jgi:ABC-type antimicrobial peptide transport system permease subunit